MTTADTPKKSRSSSKKEEQKVPQEGAQIAQELLSSPAVQEVAEIVQAEPIKLSGPFAALSQPAPTPKADEKPKGNGVKIEKDRPEQNGLKRPSAGSTCAIIWDTADHISKQTGHTCTSAELFNALQGYNECTLRTQYARWRQFNGITGRLPNQQKTVKLPADWQDAMDILAAKCPTDSKALTDLQAVTNPTELVSWIAKHATNL